MSLNRKTKKELRKLQKQAANLWESQQVLVGQAGDVAREAGRQLGKYNHDHVVPAAKHSYDKFAAPYVDRGVDAGRKVLNDAIVPAAGAVVGTALSVWDVASDKRHRLAHGKGLGGFDSDDFRKKAKKAGKKATKKLSVPQKKQGIGAGGVIAIILGVAATAGVLYAAWQTLRADDELWVADDPLRAPDA
ncbi:DNA helicase [Microbacterium sp. EYE_5]|uniref:DNA helicase n=1 Tax=unclassified Microbacterium TaxID=2609290 RepID=UPI002004FA14|nr:MULTISPECIES: DNA helicase [unclassified Microbacterium]MCK6079601.1 DNA helicase [Microbacterium sp. EYE_382]MCK6084872.1 DNA helicase [Microbacterium sp. EYE_384]MCK6122902.1 DNA helicase [Microbacterium sp. EYE_80]MCK6125635.1 DNA helicase [Microbacterium sp. EYE_79]MCK6140556.1 DNA helicase [Microbacterium sp. EYE_39]